MNITREKMEEAVDYLAGTDEDYARAKTLFDGLSEQRKTIKANCFMRAGEGSAAAKEQVAYQMPDYVMHLQKMETAELEYLTLHAKRQTAVVIIDCWRSLNAARNKGQVM